VKAITSVLLVFTFMQLALYQYCLYSISACSKTQLSKEYMALKVLTSSAKTGIFNAQLSHKVLQSVY